MTANGRRPAKLWKLLLPAVVVGVAAGVVLATTSSRNDNGDTPPPAQRPPLGVDFTVGYSADGDTPSRAAMLDRSKIDRDTDYPGCAEAVSAAVRAGAAAGWSDQPVEIAVRAEQAAAITISVELHTVSINPAPQGLGSLDCAATPPPATPHPDQHRLQASVTDPDNEQGDLARPDPVPDGVVPGNFSLQLGRGETRPFEMRVIHDDEPTIVRWTLRIRISVNGAADQTIDLDNGGQPFVTINGTLRARANEFHETWSGNKIHRTDSGTSPVPDTFDPAAAAALIRGEGYDPPADFPASGPLRGVAAMCTGNPHGRCFDVFFFDGNRLAGRVHAGLVDIESQNGREVVLRLPQYRKGDGLCCPSGQPTSHVVTLVDGLPHAIPPIPEDANNVQATG